MSEPVPGNGLPRHARPSLATRLLPWVELLAKLLAVIAAGIAISRGL